jgi:Flp pilus assembly protein TadG
MRAASRLILRCRAFPTDRRAVAAVEFAIVFPVALVLYIGAATVSDAVTTSRQLSVATRTLVDLASRQPTSSQATSTPVPANALAASTLSSMMSGARFLMYPKPTGTLKMTVSAIDVTNNQQNVCCSVLVRWSYTQGGTLRPCSTQLTGTTSTRPGLTEIPSSLLPIGTALAQPLSYLVADTSYVYQSAFAGPIFTFSPSMSRSQYMMPRMTGQVVAGPISANGDQSGHVCY